MTSDLDKILLLYIETRTGTISHEDATLLRHTLAVDESARQMWDRLEKEGHILKIDQFIDTLEPEITLQQLKTTLSQENFKINSGNRRIKFIAAAAAIAAIIVISFFIFSPKKITDAQGIASAIQQNKNAINLQLGSGKAVDLKPDIKKLSVNEALLTTTSDDKFHFNPKDTALNLLSIPAGENYRVTLSDGTLVILNADTKFRFPFLFSKKTRDVYIDGEAYFKVAKDSAHPFIVHTSLTKVEVVGTEFNINTYQSNTISTTLVEGIVKTASMNGEKEQILKPGEMAMFNLTSGFNIETVDTDDVISWTNGVYYFHNMPLQELTRLMSRVYGVTTAISDLSVSGKSVSGIMNKNNLPELLEDLKSTIGIQYYYLGGTLHIY